MSPPCLVSTDESLFDALSFGCCDITSWVALTLPYLLLGCVVSLAVLAPHWGRPGVSTQTCSLPQQMLTLGDLTHPTGFNIINFNDYQMHLCSLDLSWFSDPLDAKSDISNLTKPKPTGLLLPNLLLSGLLHFTRWQLRFTRCRGQAPARYGFRLLFQLPQAASCQLDL